MDLKEIQQKLQELRDRIKNEGGITPSSEAELKTILTDTLVTANGELNAIQEKLSANITLRAGNDNILTPEQKRRLRIIEKTGTGSQSVH